MNTYHAVEQASQSEFHCTAETYGFFHREQLTYNCLTCEAEMAFENPAGGIGFCEACSQTCHKGHELVFHSADDTFVCDCFTVDVKNECQLFHKLRDAVNFKPFEEKREEHCTVTLYGTHEKQQPMRWCEVCSTYVCVRCAEVCHSDHAARINEPEEKYGVCLCVADDDNNECKLSRPDLLPWARTNGPFIHLMETLVPTNNLKKYVYEVLRGFVTPKLHWVDRVHVNLSMNRIGFAGAEIFCEALKVNESLYSVFIIHWRLQGCGDILADAIKHSKALEEIGLAACDFTAQDLISIFQAVASNPQLQLINLAANEDVDVVGGELAEMLKATTSLQSINLSFCSLSPKFMQDLGQGLAVNRTLKILELADNRFGLEGLEPLCSALKTNNVLESLTINDIGVGGVLAAKMIGEMLSENKRLERLYMTDCRIGADGCTFIIRAFEHNSTLRFLGLRRNKLGDKGALQFLNLLRHPCSLQYIVLAENGIRQMDLASLVLAPTPNHFQANYKTINVDLSSNMGLQTPPASVCTSPLTLKKYLGDLRLGATPLRRVKIMMVGHGGVGKTTLSKRMLLRRQLYKPDLATWDNEMLINWLEDMSFSQNVASAFKYSTGSALGSEAQFLAVLEKAQIPDDEEKFLRAQVKRLRMDCERAISHNQLLYVSTRGIRTGKVELLKSSIEVTRLSDKTAKDAHSDNGSDDELQVEDDDEVKGSDAGTGKPRLNRGQSISSLEQVEVTVVDLAGQLEYLLSHAVFFRSIYAIYVLCSNLTHHPLQRAHNLITQSGVKDYATEEYRENAQWKELVLLWLDTLHSLLGGTVPVQVALTFADSFVQKLPGYTQHHLVDREHTLRSHLLEKFPKWFSEWQSNDDNFVHAVDASSSGADHPMYKAICRATLELCNRVIVPHAYEAAREAIAKLTETRRKNRELMILPRSEVLMVLRDAHEHLSSDRGVLYRAHRYLVDSLELLEVEFSENEVLNVLDPLNWLAKVMSNFITDPGHHPLIQHVKHQPGIYDWATMRHQLATICGVPSSSGRQDDLKLVMRVLCELGVCFRSTSNEDAAQYGFKDEAYIFPSSMKHWTHAHVASMWESALAEFPHRRTVVGRRISAFRKDKSTGFLPMGLAALFQNELRQWTRFKDSRIELGQGCWLVKTSTEAVLMYSDRNHSWINLCVCARERHDSRVLLDEALGLLDKVLTKIHQPRLQLYAIHPACLSTLHEGPELIPLTKTKVPGTLDSDDEDEKTTTKNLSEAERNQRRNRAAVKRSGLDIELRPENFTKHIDETNLEHIRRLRKAVKPRAPLTKRWILPRDQEAAMFACKHPQCKDYKVQGLECMWGYFPEMRWENKEGEPQAPVGSFDRPAESKGEEIDFFLSHRGPDTKERVARPAAYILKQLGFTCFFDQDVQSLRPMLENDEQMASAVWNAAVVVAVISPYYHISKYCCKELNTALRRQTLEQTKIILPVYIDVDFDAKETRDRFGMLRQTSSAICPPQQPLRRSFLKIILRHILEAICMRKPDMAHNKLKKFMVNGNLDHDKLLPKLEALLDDFLSRPGDMASASLDIDSLAELAQGSSRLTPEQVRKECTRVMEARAKQDGANTSKCCSLQ